MQRAATTPYLAFAFLFVLIFAVDASALGKDRGRPCDHRDPLRQPLFGDLHIHTKYSHDASSQGTVASPLDAYHFAMGEPLGIQPFDDEGRPLRTLRLERPLDFAGVTDHAELFGEIQICNTPRLPGHDSFVCRIYRGWPKLGALLIASHASLRAPRYDFCGEGGEICIAEARSVWQDIQAAAEATYDRSSACRFTSLIGYEWTATGMPSASNLHRNIFFRNNNVPKDPVTSVEHFPAEPMWAELDRRCREDAGCNWLAIPHNSNISEEGIFRTRLPDGSPLTEETARVRAKNEPIVEIYQHKGSSECSAAVSPADELCGFENLPYDNFRGVKSRIGNQAGPLNFVRSALGEGLVQNEKIGANPFSFGIIASTDTHLGAAGAVSESRFPGHGGATRAAKELPTGLVDVPEFSPGGLAVVWAEENTREVIFDALRRREVYGTSGPRIVMRFFGGWAYEANLCESASRVAAGYAGGVPMGGDLPVPASASGSPRFLLSALQDAGTAAEPGTPLERLQIIKLWAENGEAHERVFDVATATNASSAAICSVWTDPKFDAQQYAVYYARVLEQPTPRWHARICNRERVECTNAEDLPKDLRACCDPSWPRSIQERAWSSPIWYTPTGR
jgi:hypothetical protein